MDFIEIKINGWEKYNARRDVKKNWWFKLSNGVFDDPDMRGLSNAGFRAWVYCLSLASKRGSSNVRVYFAELSKTCHLSRKNSLSLFERLEILKIISVTNAYRTRDELVLNPVPRGEERRGEKRREEKTNTTTTVARKISHRRRSPIGLISFENVNELVLAFDEETLETWSALYPDPLYLKRQTLKAFDYYRTNSKKRPTTIGGWKRALNHWFESDWPKHIKGVPPDQKTTNWDEVFKETSREMTK